MNARMLLGTLALLGAGCDQSSVNDRVSAQTEYDFTVADDRAQFVEQGLAFRGSVGPFAVYQVTAADPKLIGPNVQPNQMVGYAMLCGATHYFLPASGPANLAMLSLHGGRSGGLELVATQQQAAHSGDCSPPKDTFGNPLPDGGDSSDDMGPTTPPVFTPPGDSPPDMTLAFNHPDTGGNLPVVQSLQVKFNPAPEPGSTVLIRRVALTGARQHNGSHVIPNICCKGGECTLAVQ
jgi:hypothetical protein